LYDSLWKSPQFQEFARREDNFLWSIHPDSEIDILEGHAAAAAEQLPHPLDNSPEARTKREEYARIGHIVDPFPGGDHQLALYNATAGYLYERCPCYRCNPYPFNLLTTRMGNMATSSDYRGRCAEARQWVIAKEREDRLRKKKRHKSLKREDNYDCLPARGRGFLSCTNGACTHLLTASTRSAELGGREAVPADNNAQSDQSRAY
jgi:hypothetical protein